jgi:HAD superfamily hydrolase (TIGR01490 family)
MIAEFTRGAANSQAELVVGLVEKWLFRRRFPDNRRTFVPFRDTAVTGCNLFALMGPGSMDVLGFWRHVENRRKKPWRIFAQFGLWSLMLLLLRRYTLRQAFAGASQKLGIAVDLCCLSQAEAAIDVDKKEDLLLATDILDVRRMAEDAAHAIKSRKRRIAIFDLDRTITRRGTFTPYLLSAKRSPLVRLGLALRLAWVMGLYKAGRLTRRELKNAMLAQTFRRASQSEIEASARHFVDRLMRSGLRETAQRAILHHKAAGDMLVLATASMDFYAEMIGRELGFDTVVATRTEWNETGPRLAGENCYGSDKLTMLQAALDIPHDALDDSQLVFYSDHHTDMPVFTWAHPRVAVNPSRRLRALAEAEDIDIVYWA